MADRARFEELLDREFEGEITPAEQSELAALAEKDPELAREAAAERRLVALLRSGAGLRAPETLARQAIARARAAVPPGHPSAGHWSVGWAAAALLLVALGGVTLLQWKPGPDGAISGGGDATGYDLAMATADEAPATQRSAPPAREQTFSPPPATVDRPATPDLPQAQADAPTSTPPRTEARSRMAAAASDALLEDDPTAPFPPPAVLYDTPWRQSAWAFAEAEPEFEPAGASDGSRYAVVQFASEAQQVDFLATYRNDTPPSEAPAVALGRRLMVLNYRREDRAEALGRMELAQAGEMDTAFSAMNETEWAVKAAPSDELKTYDELIAFLEERGGRLLFFTSDRRALLAPLVSRVRPGATPNPIVAAAIEEARKESISAARREVTTARVLGPEEAAALAAGSTPTDKLPPNHGFVVFHFGDARAANAALEQLLAMNGAALDQVDLHLAELIAQDSGFRLVLPSRLKGPE